MLREGNGFAKSVVSQKTIPLKGELPDALRKPVQLQREEPERVRHERGVNKRTVQELLAAAVQKRADALRKENSGPTRLEAAYDAILFCGLALFAVQELRVSSAPGTTGSRWRAWLPSCRFLRPRTTRLRSFSKFATPSTRGCCTWRRRT